MFQLRWPEEWEKNSKSQWGSCIVGMAIWGRKWKGRCVSCCCSNAAVVSIINSGCSRNDQAMQLMWSLFFFPANYNVMLKREHLLGVDNGAADAISRDDSWCFLLPVLSAHLKPTNISQDWTRHQKAGPDYWKVFYKQTSRRDRMKIQVRGQNRFLAFCMVGKFMAVPASETMLCHFVAHLVEREAWISSLLRY